MEQKVDILESIQFDGGLVIDEENGVIRNCKILGYESKNKRSYAKAAVQNAMKLYEGSKVNIDHCDVSERKLADRIGRIVNVQLKEKGMYGDFEYIKAHPMTPFILECAIKEMPMGFSHHAQGVSKKDKNNMEIVEEITKVLSVDLVNTPATVSTLKESEGDTGATEETPKTDFDKLKDVLGSEASAKEKVLKVLEIFGLKVEDLKTEEKPKEEAKDETKESVSAKKIGLAELNDLLEVAGLKGDSGLVSDLKECTKEIAVRFIKKLALAKMQKPTTSNVVVKESIDIKNLANFLTA